MDYKIGKILNYIGGAGDIISLNDKYLFTFDDLDKNAIFNVGDLVLFRGEEVHNVKRAFFVKKITREEAVSIMKKKIDY